MRDRSAGADLLRSWFAGFLRSREIAEIDSIIQSEQGRGSSRASSPRREGTERPMGPLQVACPSRSPAAAPCVPLANPHNLTDQPSLSLLACVSASLYKLSCLAGHWTTVRSSATTCRS